MSELKQAAEKVLRHIHHFATCDIHFEDEPDKCSCGAEEAEEALRAALESDKEQEPVACLHPSVVAIAYAMQEKLDKNATKKGWPADDSGERGWLQPCTDVDFLLLKLDEEVAELKEAVDDLREARELKPAKEAVRLEAADVSNIAMMIADNLGAIEAKLNETNEGEKG